MKKRNFFGTAVIIALWIVLCLLAWFLPARDISEAERRPLKQFPSITAQDVFSGRFMTEFEDYTLDQFPLRDGFRSLKALYSRYALLQQDNNGIYMAEGHIAETGYPLDEASVEHALKQFGILQELYLQDAANVYAAVIPDKGYYLAEESGHLSMDYDTLFAMVEDGMPWAAHIDLTDTLSLDNYYRTDTHWRQEALLPVAGKLAAAMNISMAQDYTVTALPRPFLGVYYGQAALPVKSETLYILENDILENCRVYDFVTDSYTPVYNLDKLHGTDPYDVFLSGAQSLLRLENPNAATDKELILFRDSYASSLVPLLVQDYAAVTLIDIRYIQPQLLGKYVDFAGRDVLFLYSTLVLNKNLI